MIYAFMIPVYGRLVMFGKYTLDPSDTTKKQVPEAYIEQVAEWVATHSDLNPNKEGGEG